jgi:hypothetical protein
MRLPFCPQLENLTISIIFANLFGFADFGKVLWLLSAAKLNAMLFLLQHTT